MRRWLGALLATGGLASLVSFFSGGIAFLGIPGGAVALGFAPGLALAFILAPGERLWISVARALALSPLISGAFSVILLLAGISSGPAGALIAGLGCGASLVALGRRNQAPRETPIPRWERRAVIWMAVLAMLVLLPHAREWVRVRSDAVFHTAVVAEIGARGVPPGDPYFAGLRLNYLWFYHALLAVWSGIAGVRAWDLGGAMNAMWIASLVGGVFSLSRHVRRPRREAFFATLFVPLGLSAFFYLWFPIKLARGLLGDTAGGAELQRLFDLTPFGFDQAWHFTSLFHSPPSFLNKFLVMTAWGGGVVMLVWLFEGVLGYVRASKMKPCVRWGPLVACAAFGSWVWHPAIGFSAGLSGLLAALFLLVKPGDVGRFTLLPCVGWYVAGTIPAIPLLVLSVGGSEGGSPLGISRAVPAILLGSDAALLLGIPAIFFLRSMPVTRLFRILTASTMLVSLFILLPGMNTEDKLPFVFFLLPAVAAGWMLGRWWGALTRRGKRWLALAVTLVVLVPVNAIFLAAYWLEPAKLPWRQERALYDWIRTNTEPDAVFVDTPERDEILVYGERRLYYGRESYAYLWGYDAAEMERRREVRAGLMQISLSREGLRSSSALEAIKAFRSETDLPLYVVWRRRDHGGIGALGTPEYQRAFLKAWSNEEGEVLRLEQYPFP